MNERSEDGEGIKLLLEKTSLPKELLWLVDTPLFIDATRVDSFYDAVVRPYMRQRTIVSETGTKQAFDLLTEMGVSGEVESGQLIKMLSAWLPQLKLSAEGKLSGGGQLEKSNRDEVIWEPIETPQRQLEQLCLHYAVFQSDRMHVKTLSANVDIADQTWISQVPRGLILLDLPIGTEMLPTFAEFAVEGPQQLASNIGTVSEEQANPNDKTSGTDWNVMFRNFDAQHCIEIIEKAGKSRIDAIDYRVRVPGSLEEPLHIHLEPMGQFTTLTFAYSMVKRTRKHGIRLVGTMRSGPSMCVLAAYEC